MDARYINVCTYEADCIRNPTNPLGDKRYGYTMHGDVSIPSGFHKKAKGIGVNGQILQTLWATMGFARDNCDIVGRMPNRYSNMGTQRGC